MVLSLDKKDVIIVQLNKGIRFFLIIFAIGSPFSISLAQIGLVPAMILWLFKIIFLKKDDFYGTFLDIPIFIYILGVLITSIFCQYPANAFKSIQEIWHIIMLYLLIDVADEKFLKKLINILFLFTLLTALYGTWQFFSGWDLVRKRPLKPFMPDANIFNVTGGFGLHLTYGGYVMMITLVGLSLIAVYYRKDIKMFWYYMIGTFIIGFNVLASGARSAWVGFIAGLLLWGFLKSKKWFAIILIISLLSGIILYFAVPEFKYKINTFKYINQSYRWQIWSVAASMIKDHPIIGVGNGNFKKHYDKYRNEKNWREGIGHPHNDFLSIYLTSGLIGFIGYMLMWFLIIRNSIIELNKKDKIRNNYLIGLVSGIIAFLIAGLSQNYFTDSENSMLLWFFISAILILYYKNKEKILIKNRIKNLFIKKK